MSKYTTEVRYICEHDAGLSESVGATQVDDVLSKSWDKIFGDFPIYDEAYRETLCTKILKHFYLREICCETVGIWKLWLNEKMNLIMPYYNQLYKSQLLEFNPLYDFNYTRTGSNGKNGSTSGNSNSNIVGNSTDIGTGTTRQLYSDTPQGALTGVENETYLTNATKVMQDTNNTNSNNTNIANTNAETSREDSTYEERVLGKRGSDSYSKLLLDFRKTFINIDEQICRELEDLFFALW